MAGIMANSATETMVAGDTSADNSVSGYLARESITLSVTGSPSTFSWGLSKPSGSGSVCALDDTDSASVAFSPDVEGYYVVTCLIDGATLYVLRVAVAQVSAVTSLTAVRLLPVADASVPTPPAGATLFYSSDSGVVSKKLPDGSVSAL